MAIPAEPLPAAPGQHVHASAANPPVGAKVPATNLGAPSGDSVTQAPYIQEFVDGLAKATGLDKNVIRAWVYIEGAFRANGTGHFNYLNLRPAPGGSSYSGVPLAGVSSGNFQQFGNVQDAVTETAHWLNTFSNYRLIRSSVKLGPEAQLSAIAASPWDQGHYNGGKALYDTYAQVAKKSPSWLDTVAKGAEGALFFGGQIPGASHIPGVKQVQKATDAAVTAAELPGKVYEFVHNKDNWLRIGYVLGGSILTLAGLVLLAKSVGALNVKTPAAPEIDLRGSGERQHSGRSYSGPAREGTGRGRTEGFSAEPPRRKRSASGSGPGEDIPF